MKYSHHASRTIVEITKFSNFLAHSPYAFKCAGPSKFKEMQQHTLICLESQYMQKST